MTDRSFSSIPTLRACAISPLSSPAAIWRERVVNRPLTTLSFALNYEFGSTSPFGYHLFNVLLHGVDSCLLYLVTRLLFRSESAALVTGVLFAVHPIHTEAVAWVSGRAELLAAFFFFLSWLLYLRIAAKRRFFLVSIGLSLLAFFLVILSKEHSLMLPVVLLLSNVYRISRDHENSRPWRRIFVRRVGLYSSYLAVVPVYFLMRRLLYFRPFFIRAASLPQIFVDNPLATLPFYPRWLTAVKVWGYYFALLIWPAHLSADYSYNQIPAVDSIVEREVLVALGLILAAIVIVIVSFWNKGQIWFCLLFFFVMLLPTSNILAPIGTIMAERLLYLPSAAVCMSAGIIGQSFQNWCQQRRIRKAVMKSAFAVLVLICALLALRTVARNWDWRDEYTLWRSALQVSPRSVKVHFNLGLTLLRRGLAREAIREFQDALRIYPAYRHVHLELGLAFLRVGDVNKAIRVPQEGTRIHPEDANLYVDLGTAWMKKGKIDEAIAAYRQSIARDPKSGGPL